MDLKKVNVLRKLLYKIRFNDENVIWDEVFYSPILSEIFTDIEILYFDKLQEKQIKCEENIKKVIPEKYLEVISNKLKQKDNWQSLSMELKVEYIKIMSKPFLIDTKEIQKVLNMS